MFDGLRLLCKFCDFTFKIKDQANGYAHIKGFFSEGECLVMLHILDKVKSKSLLYVKPLHSKFASLRASTKVDR
jgi:hypothetical protein